MKLTIEMPTIDACEATGCAYNANRRCHARAITVGGLTHPACDTFIAADQHVDGPAPAGVGACKTTGCRYNQELECSAPTIVVATHEGHADCATFELR